MNRRRGCLQAMLLGLAPAFIQGPAEFCVGQELGNRVVDLFSDDEVVERLVEVLEQDRDEQVVAAERLIRPGRAELVLQDVAVDNTLDPTGVTAATLR